MEKPLISIIIPVYNTEKFLYVCLNSVINQTYDNIEIIIINDGSTDNSEKIIKIFEKKDKRIKYLKQKNRGLSETRNVGINESSGNFLIFVDSDDWIDINLCKIAINNIYKHDKIDAVLWSYVKEFESKSVPNIIFNDKKVIDGKKIHKNIIGLTESALSRPENIDSLSSACLKMYRTYIIKKNKINFLDTTKIGTEDLLFNIRYFKYVKFAIVLPELLYHYRKNNKSSLTSMYKPKLKNQWFTLFNIIEKEIPNSQEFYQALNNRILLSSIGLGLNEMLSNDTFIVKYRKLQDIINSEIIINSSRNFSFSFLPLHWKIFFWSVKHKKTSIYYILLFVIKKIIRK